MLSFIKRRRNEWQQALFADGKFEINFWLALFDRLPAIFSRPLPAPLPPPPVSPLLFILFTAAAAAGTSDLVTYDWKDVTERRITLTQQHRQAQAMYFRGSHIGKPS